MPCILAIETSTEACSVAIATSSGIHQTMTMARREHTRLLLPGIESLLAAHALSLRQLDMIAFGAGPGSFTGLRIALATAQGLAYGADLPLLPISTLHTLAQTAMRLTVVPQAQMIVPAIDARMGEVYWSAYAVDESSQQARALSEEQLSSPEMLAQHPLLQDNPPFAGVGSGWHYDQLSNCATIPPQVDCYPEAYDVAMLAQAACHDKNRLLSPLCAVPTYLRDNSGWKKRQRIKAIG